MDDIDTQERWPVIYDMEIDGTRKVTQADIDGLDVLQQNYGVLRRHLKQIEQEHKQTVARVRQIHGLPPLD